MLGAVYQLNDRDGGAMGFDIEGIESVASRVNVPVMVVGVGHQSHFLRQRDNAVQCRWQYISFQGKRLSAC